MLIFTICLYASVNKLLFKAFSLGTKVGKTTGFLFVTSLLTGS